MSSGTVLATVIAEEKETVGGQCPCAAEHSWVSKRAQEPAMTLSSHRFGVAMGGEITRCRCLLA